MKSILLASVSVVAFAGAAAAEITFTGEASLGYNDTDQFLVSSADAVNDDDFGFYSDLDVTVVLSQELDNGLTVAASLDLEDLGTSGAGDSYELSLTSDTAGLFYGDTNFAAQNHFVEAGDMAANSFSEADGEVALRGDVTFGSVSASVSYVLDDSANTAAQTSDLNQLSIGATADFGNVNVALGYQEASGEVAGYYAANGDFNDDEVFGVSVGTSFGGADVRIGYADNSVETSTGLSVSYPVGPVALTASYSDNSVSGETWNVAATYANGPMSVTVSTDEGDDWGIEGSYDVGNGLTVFAGAVDAGEDLYVGGSYDLGSGASLLVSYADDGDADEDDDDDDIGAQDYQVGTTVELNFAF